MAEDAGFGFNRFAGSATACSKIYCFAPTVFSAQVELWVQRIPISFRFIRLFSFTYDGCNPYLRRRRRSQDFRHIPRFFQTTPKPTKLFPTKRTDSSRENNFLHTPLCCCFQTCLNQLRLLCGSHLGPPEKQLPVSPPTAIPPGGDLASELDSTPNSWSSYAETTIRRFPCTSRWNLHLTPLRWW